MFKYFETFISQNQQNNQQVAIDNQNNAMQGSKQKLIQKWEQKVKHNALSMSQRESAVNNTSKVGMIQSENSRLSNGSHKNNNFFAPKSSKLE